jgi:hypothetical protein
LSVFDLGGSASLLQAIYEEDKAILKPVRPTENGTEQKELVFNDQNWTSKLGKHE